MGRDYQRIECFIGKLIELNSSRGQFKIEDANTIAIKGLSPRYVVYPTGYYYNTQRKIITNGFENFMVLQQR